MATAWGVPVGVAFPAVADVPAEEGDGDGTGVEAGVGGAAGGVVVQDESSRPAPMVSANRTGVRVAFKAFS
ncbi:hypothetical protein GCM10011577_38010 [Pseudarthrobacter polychromogenes]|uniref:Uncharacterized protein n=1 Tax=Pseudarthrobacter polychromogenes TaxID=1676 RepID=A0ABQ1Y2J6_9MICC|nr:hypothetical protein GCM10011577_38010 [Pseudarthrobacter polychromogenes]